MTDAARRADRERRTGVGTYRSVGDITMVIPRHYKNSYAPAIGVEWHGPGVMLGAGYSYETAAALKGYVSVADRRFGAKHLIGIGGGYMSCSRGRSAARSAS